VPRSGDIDEAVNKTATTCDLMVVESVGLTTAFMASAAAIARSATPQNAIAWRPQWHN
jgi:hypothetical protein